MSVLGETETPVGRPDTVALTLLRDKADGLRASVTLTERRADEAWNEYRRYADSARERWREHAELIEAIRALEAVAC